MRSSVVTIGMIALMALACDRQKSTAAGQSGPPPPVVGIVTIAAEDVTEKVDFVGQLDSAHSVVLKPEISGVVESISFEEGKPVKQGTALVHLRNREQHARVREAQARVDLARNNHQRIRSLTERNAVSEADLESAHAELEIAEARLELAKIQLDRTVVRAPFDGVTGPRLVSPGERVRPGGEGGPSFGGEPSGLVRIDSLDEMELIFTLPETVMGLASIGVRVDVRVAPFPGETFEGIVYFVDPRIDATSRRVLVKAHIPNPERKLRPGLFANLDVEIESRKGALMVPEDAVVYGGEGTYVWRVVEDKAVRVPVELGIRQPGRVELRSGVRAGDRIITAGTHKVRPGSVVRDVASLRANSQTDGT
jgi:membrane fusion protein (multidrug efflux system)